jgi:enoyl-CoA hydratase/carnithine racemase
MINGLAYGGAAVLASSLDMRVGCEDSRFRFLAAAYGRINSTWTLPNQVGWPIAKELLFSARVVEAEEAYRIGLLNHLVPREQLRAKTMELGHQGIAARPNGTEPRTAMEQGAALHDACRSRRQGRGSLSRIHRPQRPTSFAVSSRLVKAPIKLLQQDRFRRSANTDFPSRLPCYSCDRESRFRESGSLQWRVSCEPDFLDQGQHLMTRTLSLRQWTESRRRRRSRLAMV